MNFHCAAMICLVICWSCLLAVVVLSQSNDGNLGAYVNHTVEDSAAPADDEDTAGAVKTTVLLKTRLIGVPGLDLLRRRLRGHEGPEANSDFQHDVWHGSEVSPKKPSEHCVLRSKYLECDGWHAQEILGNFPLIIVLANFPRYGHFTPCSPR